MSGMKSWSVTPANNVLANTGFTMDEGMSPSSVNDSIRQLMADVRTEWAQGASIASAATVDLSTSTGGYVTISGSTGPITSFGTVSAGIRRRLLFTGTPTITYNATSLITPTSASIVVVAGDTCEVMSEGSGNWRVLWYAGQTIQAASLGASAKWGTGVSNFGTITKRKTADESVTSSTTLQDDDHLTFAIAANEEWTIDYHISCDNSPSTTGAQVAVTTPSGATQEISFSADTTLSSDRTKRTTTSGGGLSWASGTFSVGTGAFSIQGRVWVLNGATPGNVTLQFAQGTSNGTALTFRKGSHMSATRVA